MQYLIERWAYIESNLGLGSVFVFFLCLGVIILGVRECYVQSGLRRDIANELARRALRHKVFHTTLPSNGEE